MCFEFSNRKHLIRYLRSTNHTFNFTWMEQEHSLLIRDNQYQRLKGSG